MTDIERMALEILGRIAKRNVEELETNLHLIGDLGIDSPKALELICDIEDDLGLEFPDSAIDQLNTVGDLMAMVRSASSAPVGA